MVVITMDQSDTKHLQETLKRQLWSEAGLWMQDRAQTLWGSGMPDEAAALYSEFARGPATVSYTHLTLPTILLV